MLFLFLFPILNGFNNLLIHRCMAGRVECWFLLMAVGVVDREPAERPLHQRTFLWILAVALSIKTIHQDHEKKCLHASAHYYPADVPAPEFYE